MTDILDSGVISQTDASNNSGTLPTFAENMAPSQVNDSARALMGAVARWAHHANYTLYTGGSTNAYTLTYAVAPAAYRQGDVYCFIASAANTGSCTLNVNALGAKTIKREDGNGGVVNLVAGDIRLGTRVMVHYNVADDAFYYSNFYDQIISGTFTPALKFGGASVGMTTSTASGEYVKIGQSFIGFTLRITLTAKGSSTGAATITGLPFSADSLPIWAGASGYYAGMLSMTGGLGFHLAGTTINLTTSTATAAANLTDANFGASSDLVISGVYKVA